MSMTVNKTETGMKIVQTVRTIDIVPNIPPRKQKEACPHTCG
jgi:hypothetical protein